VYLLFKKFVYLLHQTIRKMETILKVTGLSELEFKKLYLDSMNLMIATGCTETEAREIVIGVLKKSLGIN
jgi:hypothetical protein